MSRPVGANAEETRRKILNSASGLFAAHGFEGTSVRQIAAGADVSLGMIRHYFGSKDGLHQACMDSAFCIYGALGDRLKEAVATGQSVETMIKVGVREGYRFALDNVAACKLVLWHLMEQETWRHDRGDRVMMPFILETAAVFAAVLGAEAGPMALRIRTLIFLITRYATADEDELAALLCGDMGATASSQTRDQIEEHLVAVGLLLIR